MIFVMRKRRFVNFGVFAKTHGPMIVEYAIEWTVQYTEKIEILYYIY